MENPFLPLRQSKLIINKHWTITVQLLLSWHWIVIIRCLLRFLTISRVIDLHLKQDWFLRKAKTRGYKFSKKKENPVLPPKQSKLLINKHWTVIVQPLLSWHWIVIVRRLLRFLAISRVIDLHFKRDFSRWKAMTRGYKFCAERRP
jgi:hypothetical protein